MPASVVCLEVYVDLAVYHHVLAVAENLTGIVVVVPAVSPHVEVVDVLLVFAVDLQRRQAVVVSNHNDVGIACKTLAIEHQGVVYAPILNFLRAEALDGLEVVPV